MVADLRLAVNGELIMRVSADGGCLRQWLLCSVNMPHPHPLIHPSRAPFLP